MRRLSSALPAAWIEVGTGFGDKQPLPTQQQLAQGSGWQVPSRRGPGPLLHPTGIYHLPHCTEYRASRVTVNKLRHDVVNNVARSDKWPTLSAKVEVERDRSMVITLTVKEGACLAGLSHPHYKPGITSATADVGTGWRQGRNTPLIFLKEPDNLICSRLSILSPGLRRAGTCILEIYKLQEKRIDDHKTSFVVCSQCERTRYWTTNLDHYPQSGQGQRMAGA